VEVYVHPRVNMTVNVSDPFDQPSQGLEYRACMHCIDFAPVITRPLRAGLTSERHLAGQDRVGTRTRFIRDSNLKLLRRDSKLGFSLRGLRRK